MDLTLASDSDGDADDAAHAQVSRAAALRYAWSQRLLLTCILWLTFLVVQRNKSCVACLSSYQVMPRTSPLPHNNMSIIAQAASEDDLGGFIVDDDAAEEEEVPVPIRRRRGA